MRVFYLPENSNSRTELQALFNLVDCAGLEQFFTVERRLFSNDRLRNRWQCCVCSRTFDTSRSLAQPAFSSIWPLSMMTQLQEYTLTRVCKS
jgi:hypothetical protein